MKHIFDERRLAAKLGKVCYAVKYAQSFNIVLIVGALASLMLCAAVTTHAATLPNGFTETRIATNIASPTAMAFAPDGRIFICQQNGQLRVVRDGQLLATPFVSLAVDASGERGLLGLAFDPDFATNNFIYLYYTTATAPIHNRVSRFTAAGDVAAPNSGTVLLDLDNLSSATNHNGGAMHFGADGKLYIAVGENAFSSNAQTLSNLLGKMLRMNPDGTIPIDNPFYSAATGKNRLIWALGLRNPFTFNFQPGTNRMFINDVGQNVWEEVNEGFAGANYGWPFTEGPTNDARFVSPVYAYQHGAGSPTGCAITGGVFYNPPVQQFPGEYTGSWFFADYCSGWIYFIPQSIGSSATQFASGASSPVDLQVGADGSLYYLQRGAGGSLYRIVWTASQVPVIAAQPASQTVPVSAPVTFGVTVSGTSPFMYQWQRNGINIPGANAASYTIPNVSASDNGAQFRVVVTNAFGSATSDPATLTVSVNQTPTATITSPAAGTLFAMGETYTFSGTATDTEDGVLPASAYTWQIDFFGGADNRPFLPPTSGVTSGTFTLPVRLAYTEPDIFYRIYLRVTDSNGQTTTVTRDIFPRTATVTLATAPANLQVTIDGQPRTAPYIFTSVVGLLRTIGTEPVQTLGGTTYDFFQWSDGGIITRDIATPAVNTTYTATFRPHQNSSQGLVGTYFDNSDLSGSFATRLDAVVDFDWSTGAPIRGIDADTFSVRWTGQVQPQFSETYTFYTLTDDGVRLWVNGVLLIDDWSDRTAATENLQTITLVGGQRYDIRMEYYDASSAASARLSWSSASQPKQVIPANRLIPPVRVKRRFIPSAVIRERAFFSLDRWLPNPLASLITEIK